MKSLPSHLAALVALALSASTTCTHAAQATATPASYCTATGGAATTLRAYAGTNNAARDWVAYGGIVQACIYTADDGSQITLWDSTLASPAPTMAALAYYAQVPYAGGGPGNPSTYYCEQLKGAWQVGNGIDGGGWAAAKGANVYGMCVFADGSAIDAWGLMYHSAGIVRGVDLASVLRFANPY